MCGDSATIQSAVDLARRGGRAAIIGLAMGDARSVAAVVDQRNSSDCGTWVYA